MSNVESSLVISNRRSTVGFVHTSASAPPARVSRRSALSSTLRPVESMNMTPVRSSTSAVRPLASESASSPLKSGAVLTWISPSTAMTVVRSSTSRWLVRNLGSAKDTAAPTLPGLAARVNRGGGPADARAGSAEPDPAMHRRPALLLVDRAGRQAHLDRPSVGLAQQRDGLLRQRQRPAAQPRALG